MHLYITNVIGIYGYFMLYFREQDSNSVASPAGILPKSEILRKRHHCNPCIHEVNKSFPSSCLPPLQSEFKCEIFVIVISSTLHMNEI